MNTIGNDRLRSLAEGWAHTAATLVSDCSLAGSQYSANCTDTAVAMQELVSLRAENERLNRLLMDTHKAFSNAQSAANAAEAELAALRRPVGQSDRDLIGKDYALLQEIRNDPLVSYPHSKLKKLLRLYDATARQLRERVEMLSFVQDSLTERNRECVELRERCGQLESDAKQYAKWVEPQLVRLGREMARAEALEAAIGKCILRYGINSEVVKMLQPGLAASQQHTAGSGDGVAGD